MRVPSLHKKPKAKWVLAGAAIGFCLSWLLFLYMFGAMQERQTVVLEKQKNDISELRTQLEIWQEEFKELNKKNLHKLTVQEIEVDIINYEKYGIDDAQSIFSAKEQIKKDLSVLYAKDLETVYSHKELIRQSIENKTLKINKRSYSLHVKEWHFYTTIHIQLEMELEGS
ncbi:sporulation protein [Bacillus aerolatus]|uniref:Sporulation protein n=1 Tax=Bacillus aerolatus TaxID=2653354 RepID=A0A6I1FI56_9BACI|nr:sporulation membrane protein YtrI [Bacillus aerolatus]KAB7705913.1 sporulation protein [Bacillus aerolatus]